MEPPSGGEVGDDEWLADESEDSDNPDDCEGPLSFDIRVSSTPCRTPPSQWILINKHVLESRGVDLELLLLGPVPEATS